MMLWGLTLRWLIKKGRLTVTDARGKTHHYGQKDALPAVTIRLLDAKLHTSLFLNPRLHFGEAYMDGTLTVEPPATLRDLLDLIFTNFDGRESFWLMKLHEKVDFCWRWLQQYNPLQRARHNVSHHYDIGLPLYESFLDKDMQYSCGYFENETDTLEEAQANKKRHIAAKLRIEPGMKVLDIGCGFGGMALYLARELGAQVTGITLSEMQLEKARARAKEQGLEHRAQFFLRDFRDEKGSYDRIVSVGMFEHVGVRHYREFFAKVKSLLKPRGIALLHAIGRMDGPGSTNEWLRKYIFPGGYAPAMSEVLPHIEKTGLWATDIEVLRMHYAWTLENWYKRFEARRVELAAQYDERFCRMWEFYLVACEMQFRYQQAMVFQMQIARDIGAVPYTRDYMYEYEQALATTQRLNPARRHALH